jgi:hypothetical protein
VFADWFGAEHARIHLSDYSQTKTIMFVLTGERRVGVVSSASSAASCKNRLVERRSPQANFYSEHSPGKWPHHNV